MKQSTFARLEGLHLNADIFSVFLASRTKDDLERNALVSGMLLRHHTFCSITNGRLMESVPEIT